MVCIAAFIILGIIGAFVALLSIFWPKIGKAYWKIFKKSWGCLSKKVRLQKCETGFKEDVKNTILSRVLIKHPKWTKPLSIILEIISVIIVIIFIWAVATAIKSLLALWALGTCNVTKPAACTMGAEICSIDSDEPKNPLEATSRWFTEWGEIFEAIPEKFKTYRAEDYDFNYITISPDASEKPVALDIFDPGCSVCMKSYQAQKSAGFFDDYSVRLVPYPIKDPAGNYKFKNSAIFTKYLFAAEQLKSGAAVKLLDHLFTDKNQDGLSFQTVFNEIYSETEAIAQIETWLEADGADDSLIKEITKIVNYPEITDKLDQNQSIVESMKLKGIPTMIYDGTKHTGLFKM